MKTKSKNRMPELKSLAAAHHCTVVDDRNETCLSVEANDGWSWDDGTRSANVHQYGSGGDYRPEWRQEAIAEAIADLQQNPPVNIPYCDE
jgi:hypothetical protein